VEDHIQLGINDIPKAILVLSKAYEHLVLANGRKEVSDTSNEEFVR
jgi:hypothetical protein